MMEILVAIVVSGIVLSAVLVSYVSLTNSSRKIDLSRQLQREANFAMIRISDRIRSQAIDYAQYDVGQPCDTDENLCLSNATITRENENLWFQNQPLFSDIFSVKKAKFEISPTSNPGKFGTNQPRVKIILEVGAAETNPVKIKPLLLQTTISSRVYE